MVKIKWLIYRLRAMSSKEVIYRIYKILINNKNRIKYRNDYYITEFMKDQNIDIHKVDYNMEKIFKLPNLSNINFSKDDKYDFFNERIDITNTINWHKGLYSNWDAKQYSNSIDFKNKDNIGDIRYTWEINRHQFFPYLALKYKLTKNEKYYEVLENHLETWIENNPFLKGVNWSSSMEIAIRSYQWMTVFYLLKDENKDKFRERLIKYIIFSMNYVSNNISKYSSANNHLIVETYICSMIGFFIKDVYKQTWFEDNYQILNNEVIIQFYEDGVNKEQALHYQAFVVDAILQYNFFLKKINKKTLHEEIIKKSLIFMGSLDVHKKNYEFGDSDDAKLIDFNFSRINYYKYILSLGSIYYDTKFIDFKDIQPIVEMISGISKIPQNNYEYKQFSIYKSGGYGVIKTQKTSLLYDFGNLGMGSLAAHGHADSLAIIYHYDDLPIFIDPGTFIYNIKSEMRNYFRSTHMHNTLCYDNCNQSEIKGPFLWGRKAETNVLEYVDDDDIYSIFAEHNGYYPSIHKRRLKFIKKIEMIIIEDIFDKKAVINFILNPQCKFEKIDDYIYKITINSSNIFMYTEGVLSLSDIKISSGFLCLQDSKKITISNDFSIKTNLITIFSNNKEDIKKYIHEGGRV